MTYYNSSPVPNTNYEIGIWLNVIKITFNHYLKNRYINQILKKLCCEN